MRSALAAASLALALSCAHPGRQPAGSATPAATGLPCSSCHGERLAAQRALKSVHPVLRDEAACGRCHLPHDTKTTAPLANAEPKLCNACHGDRAFMRPHGGRKGTSQCTRCHAPHASDQARLLLEPPATLCGSCHLEVSREHSGYPVGGSRCTECHQVHGGESHLIKPVVHEVAADCSNCHAAANSERPLAVGKAAPGLCLDCHPDVGEKIPKLAVPHPPARDGACLSCHSPHASTEEALLAGPQREVCGACHAPVIAATQRPQPHKPAADGRCAGCHRSHGGERAKLLAQPADALCTSCHPDVEKWVAKKHVHAPLQMGDCAACHDPHGGEKRLLKGAATALCLRCHAAGKEGFVASSHVHRPEPTGECLGCHDPHASDSARLVTRSEETLCKGCHEPAIAARRAAGEKLHTPFLGGNCAACHTPHAAGKAGLRAGDVCVVCHVGTRQTWTKGQSVHSPFVDGSCQSCHEPHGSKQLAMLKATPNALCGECHFDVQGELEKPGAVVHDPLKTGACTDCHRGHGSTQPDLLLAEPARLCAECHDLAGERAIRRHGGFAIAGADCTGCHLPHAGARKGLLREVEHMPFGSGDCKSCHDEPASPARPAKLRGGGLELCGECHDFKAMTKLPNAHAPVAAGKCFACHAPHVGTGKAMLQATGVALCVRCHDPRKWGPLPAHQPKGAAIGDCERCHPHHAPKAAKTKRR